MGADPYEETTGGPPGNPLPRLRELAYNLWWTWQPDAVALFRDLDPAQWDATEHRPLAALARVTPDRWAELARDTEYLARCQTVLARFDHYLHPTSTWFSRTHPGDGRQIAYFCAEFGFHESVPIYAGGLGILAGDHCKTASDLGIPLTAVGLWYPRGYFHQRLDDDGHQLAEPEVMPLEFMPLTPAGPDGADLIIQVPLGEEDLAVQVWRVRVGRISVYLLDTNLAENQPEHRAICAHLYGGDRETRIAQEVVLGIGGVRALRALGIAPTIWHMNEGHAAFMGLERMREFVSAGMDFTEAWPAQASTTVFTTHTPVPAGNEIFRDDLAARYLGRLPAGLGLDLRGMLDLANEAGAPQGTFAMTPLALRLSHRANGVSALHGKVARAMWQKQFPGLTVEQVPITSVTNGVHTGTWIGDPWRSLLDQYLGQDWLAHPDDPDVWQRLDQLPDSALWNAHLSLKHALFTLARTRATGPMAALVAALDPAALTIGFARRFATYKRATLLFHDLDRIARLLTDLGRPVQVIFAGKAHPADAGGQGLIQALVQLSRQPALAGKVVFLEGYDHALGRALVQGVDLWLNNPERPQEASGTSGQKAGLNGVPNCSIRDGWWDEGFQEGNGWAFGGEIGDDYVDSDQLYTLLEREIVPLYYDRNESGISPGWLEVMRASMRTVGQAFSAARMVKEYLERMYHPA
ncbi:MAG TPA: alpha-glucan family phosphorylase [Chloroflexota bacterium]|nr:alpha-glucan family phosphorylase [Chloroflexota bacterium]